MHLLKANTAVDVLIGPFLDSTDGNTAETGLTIAQADVRLSKNGQNVAQKNDANAAAHDELGYHNCPLNATDTNTEGQLDLLVHEAGALAVRHQYSVISEAAWDSMFAAKDTGYMDVNVKAVSEDTTAADNAEAFFDGTGYAGTNNVIPTVTTLTGHTAQTGDSFAIVNGTHGLVSIQDDVDAILTDTGTTLNTLILDIPTVAEFEARTIASADYTVVGDTIAGVTTVNGLAANVITAASINTGAFSADAFAANALVAATFNADCITAAKVAADVHTEGATAVWASSNSTLTKAYSLIMEQIYQFLHNDMNITDATGAVALRNLANNADMATWGITDNDTTTARTDVVWV